jgi:hypothetical protein
MNFSVRFARRRSVMAFRLIAAAAAVALLAPAGANAADMAAPPPGYAPPGTACAVLDRAPPVIIQHGRKKLAETDYARIITVGPYDPRCPHGLPPQLYVTPQTAYLVSSPTRFTECDWPCIDSIHHDWYDGRLWYHNAGTPQRPDVFMIIQRD